MATDTTTLATPGGARRCFICFMDEGESGGSSSDWVNPCPCSLEAHQDCMLDWVANLEREKKELRCPVCKSPIFVEGPWDPVIALSDELRGSLSRVSPSLLISGLGFGTAVGLGTYGLFAIRVFAGPDALMRYLYRWSDGRLRLNAGHLLLAPWIGPGLVLGQSFPYLANVLFIPAATLYGILQLAHDESFLTWPPSPQLAIMLFPPVKQIYNTVYHELFCAWEKRMDRQLMGLADPDLEHQAEEQLARGAAADDANGNGNGNDNGNARPQRLGFLHRAMDFVENLLDLPNFEVELQMINEEEENGQAQGVDDGFAVDIALEVVENEGDGVALQAPPNFGDMIHDEDFNFNAPLPPPADAPPALPAPVVGGAPAANNPPANPPALQNRLQGTLIDMSNAIVSALLLPTISYGMGELLRLVLPRKWTTPTQVGMFRLQTGFFQERWGRSLLGGCIYVMLKDVFRLYTKHRRVVNKPLRRVRNIERRRPEAGATPS